MVPRPYPAPTASHLPGMPAPGTLSRMNRGVKIVLAVVVAVAVLAGGGFYLFERHDRATLVAAAGEACGDKTNASTQQQLPLGLPLTEGASVLRSDTQGSTSVAFASLPGDRDTSSPSATWCSTT